MKKILRTNALIIPMLVLLFSFYEVRAQQTVFFTSPVAGDTLNRGQTYNITWTYDEDNAQPIMKLRTKRVIDGITSYGEIRDSVIIQSGSFSYTVPKEETPNLSTTIQAISSDTAEIVFGETGAFTFSETVVGINKQEISFNTGLKTFPNPFCGSTNICYTLHEGSQTSIQLLDLQGKEIRNIKNEWQAAGDYTLLMDAKDLPAGIYLLKLQTNKALNTVRVAVQ